MYKSELESVLTDRLREKPKGGERLQSMLKRAEQKGILRLFVPWAAPASGRDSLSTAEAKSIDWLAGEGSLTGALSKIVDVSLFVMPADSYARRNNFNLARARSYWQLVAASIQSYRPVEVIPSSILENVVGIQRLLAEEAYALEKLDTKTASKVVAASERYTGAKADVAYNKAGTYCMYRAAEARFVVEDLDALWLSFNWPERDAMCGQTPRIYAPEDVRAPWLKETV